MELAIIVSVVVVALVFDYTNGFHDAANAIATSVSTRALTPRVALGMAALMNFVGAFLGQKVAKTVSDTISPPDGSHGLVIVMAGLLGAIAWNLHHLVLRTAVVLLPRPDRRAGGCGRLLRDHRQLGDRAGEGRHPDVPLARLRLLRRLPGDARHHVGLPAGQPARANRGFRIAQTISAAAMALGHGLQDAQKTMGVIFLALLAGGYVAEDDPLPLWVIVAAATAISLGTWSGGWRIMRTLGRRIIHLDPPRGFAAETVAASVLYTTAYVFEAPISTTHTITSAVMGVGATKRLSAVRWGVARSILLAWVLTFPMAGLAAGLCYWLTHLLLEVLP